MQIQTWRIQGGSFHFGRQGLGQEETRVTFPSDSLFAALIARLALLEGGSAVEKFIQPFCEGKPPFVVTSTFPLANDVLFFPVPLTSLRVEKELPKGMKFKSLKKVKYVSEGIYRQLVAGRRLVEFAAGQAHETFWTLPDEKIPAQLWKVERRPRVTVERGTNKSTLYFTGGVTFAENCGLWFGIRWLESDAALQKQVENLLEDLCEAGLGAERSAGMGKAKITSGAALELPDPTPAGAWTNLSRYLPREDEINAFTDPQAAYQIERVGGWLDSHVKRGQRRRAVNMLTEGAVLGWAGRETPGRVEDVAPKYETNDNPQGHSVYRCGMALAVGFGGAK